MPIRRKLAHAVIAGFGVGVALLAHSADVESRVKSAAIPVYPDIARVAGISGTVEVAASIDGTGTTRARVMKSSNEFFDEPALDAARHWRLSLAQGEEVKLVFRFTSLPACSIPSTAQIYSPPFVVDVFAATGLGVVMDGEQLTCPQVSVVAGPGH